MTKIKLFTRPITIGNQTVYRPLNFYVGLNKVGINDTCNLIRENGGNVVAVPGKENSNIIALIDPNAKANPNGRTAYSVEYIQKCIDENKLLDMKQFRIIPPKGSTSRKQKQKRNLPNQNTMAKNKFTEESDEEMNENISPTIQTQTEEKEKGNSMHIQEEQNEEQDHEPTGHEEAVYNSAPEMEQILEANEETHEQVNNSNEQTLEINTEEILENNVIHENDEHEWTQEEDNKLLHLFAQAASTYRDKDLDVQEVLKLPCWTNMEKQMLLPSNRSAEQCLERVQFIRSKREGDPQSSTHRDRSPVKRPRSKSDADVINRRRSRKKIDKQFPSSHGLRRASDGKIGRSKSGSRATIVVNGGSGEEHVKRLVRFLATKGNISRRRAFRVLREEQGNWKSALHTITRRQS